MREERMRFLIFLLCEKVNLVFTFMVYYCNITEFEIVFDENGRKDL